jgi:transcriptional regulator with XRE-family HTH domain
MKAQRKKATRSLAEAAAPRKEKKKAGSPLAVRIRSNRVRLGLRQDELALKIQVAQSSLSCWETGKREPGLREAEALAKLFGLSIDALLHGVATKAVK